MPFSEVSLSLSSDRFEAKHSAALVRFPPVGRTKRTQEDEYGRQMGKAMGRNEIIADYILQVTGEERIRKQVSSHLQVLREFTKDNVLRTLAEASTAGLC